MKKILALVCALAIACVALAGCSGTTSASGSASTSGSASASAPVSSTGLADGEYTATFTTDNGTMFRLNETLEGRAPLTVKDGQAILHITLSGDGILELYKGTADDACQDGAETIKAVPVKVTYPDGMTSTVNSFDVPVDVLDEEFELALIGTKGKWYDHKVIVGDAQPAE